MGSRRLDPELLRSQRMDPRWAMFARTRSIRCGAIDRGEDALHDRERSRWTPRDRDVDRDHARDAAAARIAFAEDAACATAVADRDNELRLGCRLVRADQRRLHVA